MDNVNQPDGKGPRDQQDPGGPWLAGPEPHQQPYQQDPYEWQPSGPGRPAQPPAGPGSHAQPPGGPDPYALHPGGPGPHPQQPGGPDTYTLHPGGAGPYAQQAGGQYPPTQQFPRPGPQPPRRNLRWMQNRKVRWGAGIAAAVILSAGGATAGLALTGSSAAPPANDAQAVALNSAMGYTTGCSLSSVTKNAGSAAIKADRMSLRRCLRARLRVITGMYGEIAYHTTSGTQTLAFERGSIVSTGAGQLSVKADDGTTWTWDEASSPIIRENGKQAGIGALQTGTKVFVGGLVDGGSREARLIIVHAGQSGSGRKPSHSKKAAKSSSSSGGPSGTVT